MSRGNKGLITNRNPITQKKVEDMTVGEVRAYKMQDRKVQVKDKMDKRGKFKTGHLKKMSLKEVGFVMDYLMTDNATEAARRNYDVNPDLASRFAWFMLQKPKIKAAIDAELKKVDEDITEDYIKNGLMELETDAKSGNDLQARARTYDLMMKLKGLGAQRVINENVERKAFEFDDPLMLHDAMVDTLIALEERELLDIPQLIEDIETKKAEKAPELPEITPTVEVIEDFTGDSEVIEAEIID